MSSATSDESGARAFRDALGMFVTGITVVTARDRELGCIGITVNSFNSVSLRPPLVLWSLSLNSPTLRAFERCSHYAVNVLAADQEALSRLFASAEPDKFASLDARQGRGGAPLLPGCCAWFECRNHARHPGGDHLIFVGEVERYECTTRLPLVYFRGAYRQLLT